MLELLLSLPACLQIQLTFAASVMMLEGYLGLSDVPSLAKILGRIAPRSLLLVGGGTAQISQLAAACSSQLSKQQTKIVTPGGHCAWALLQCAPLET